mmetsp:Transcript_22422/g.39419  ORF Transcript_22422/g.39419 Transcript_22422/m.39419 type:complete len:589 (-) Transcript_22422:47-1813(-)
MGQCQPLSIPSSYSLDEEEFSVAATPHGLFPCSAINMQVGRPQLNDVELRYGNEKDIRKCFLKLHRPDMAQRCIIDPDEVMEQLLLQADELLRRRGLVQYEESEEVEDDHMSINRSKTMDDFEDRYEDGQGTNFDGVSQVGATSMISGTTSASRSTIVAGNIRNDRKNFKKKMRSRFGDGTVASSLSGRNTNSSSMKSLLESVNELEDEDSLDSIKEITIEDHMSSASSKLNVATHGNRTSFLSGFVRHSVSEVDSRRDHYMSVLRLKMKARLGQFYSQRFLMMFPDGPRPHGIDLPKRKSDSVPDLTQDSSSDSSSSGDSSHIDYGNLPPAIPVKCSVTDDAFLDLAITGCLGLVPRQGTNSRSSSYQSRKVTTNRNLKSPDHYIVLINRRSGIPLAVCALKAASGDPIVRIYATRKRVFAQKPAATTQQLGLDWSDDLPLYSWAEVVSEGRFPDEMKFSIFMANGSEGRFSPQASYEASFDGNLKQPVIMMMGKTDMDTTFSGCALISIRVDEDTGATHRKSGFSNLCLQIDLSRGIDPALLICFTAIADEVIEKSMRLQCKEQARKRIHRASCSLAKKRHVKQSS